MSIKQLEKSGILAVKMLRKSKLSMGLPFMINTYLLPTNQCYLEFPDGAVKLVTVNSKTNDYIILKELTPEESYKLRIKYKLT